jgi:hypothetical protein
MSNKLQAKAISRERVFERLDWLVRILNILCYRNGDVGFLWPPGWLLGEIDQCVMFLIELDRKKPPLLRWKTFKMLDRRMRLLRLVPRIDSLVKRAIERRQQKCSQSVLEKAVRRPDSLETQILLRDCVEKSGKFVDLLRDHDNRVMERMASSPLLVWLCAMEHPDARNLILRDIESIRLAGTMTRAIHLQKVSRRRLKARERQKRYRLRQNSLPEKRYTSPS